MNEYLRTNDEEYRAALAEHERELETFTNNAVDLLQWLLRGLGHEIALTPEKYDDMDGCGAVLRPETDVVWTEEQVKELEEVLSVGGVDFEVVVENEPLELVAVLEDYGTP